MQQGGFPGIVETQEEKFGVLVQQAQRGEDIVDYSDRIVSGCFMRWMLIPTPGRDLRRIQRRGLTYTS